MQVGDHTLVYILHVIISQMIRQIFTITSCRTKGTGSWCNSNNSRTVYYHKIMHLYTNQLFLCVYCIFHSIFRTNHNFELPCRVFKHQLGTLPYCQIYMSFSTRASLVKIMICLLLVTKPSYKAIQLYRHLGLSEYISDTFALKIQKIFHNIWNESAKQ